MAAAPRIYRSSYPDVDVAECDVLDFVFSNPNNVPDDKPIYLDAATGAQRSYGQVKERTKSLAQGLRDLGVQPRDFVAVISPNSIEYAILCFAVIGCGATVTRVSAAYTAQEVEAQFSISGAKLVIAHSSLLTVVQEAVRAIPGGVKIIQADGDRDANGEPTAEYLASHAPASPLVRIEPSEASSRLAFMCFSSGTSGRPKGVMSTHRNITACLQQFHAHVPLETAASLTTINFLPFSHIYGVVLAVFSSSHFGSTGVVLPRFDPVHFLSAIQQHRPECVFVVPPIMLLLAKSPVVALYDLSSIRRLRSAAAPLSDELRQAVEARFRALYGTTVHASQAWGMTEITVATIVPSEAPHKRHTVGNITPNMSFRVVDPLTLQDVALDPTTGATLPGELWCRGPNVTPGYYRNTAATRDGFSAPDPRDGQPWFRTGDMGSIDADGYFTIVDRIKEMIKYKGFQVTPSELEGKLLEHPLVEDACVVGHWVEAFATELPVAFVVLAAAAKKRAPEAVVADIHAWLNRRVANHKQLRGGVLIVDAIRKNPSGKILRREMKASLADHKTHLGAKL